MGFRKLLLIVSAAALLLSITHAGADGASTVEIRNFAFNPGEVSIAPGDTVTWTNLDPAKHDVDFGTDKSPLLSKGETYSRTFSQPGVYEYNCDVHPAMKGRVVVK